METNSKLIWSADVDEMELYKVLSSGALPKGTIVKLDRFFFERFSKENIRTVQNMGYPVFVDSKIIEVPKKVLQIAEAYLQYRPFMLNVMAGVCSTGLANAPDINKVECLKRFAELCERYGTKSCAVTVLTSKTPAVVSGEYLRTAIEQVLWYVQMLHSSGLTDVVCSPQEVAEIRKHDKYAELKLNTPGVRMLKTDARDQARVTTPADALKLGADRLVIGSNITDGEGDVAERVFRNFENIRVHCIEEAGVDIADGIECD